ncbi:MAG TPA: glycosyltransferase family 2 protein [Vicinamibacterales bacterium]|nr:glycosyltransferase family 2 protein [Vicinamibacterales bacterium]
MKNGISVVISTYNGARFIGDAISSVLAQTRLPAEIVIVDDCSTDETAAVVESVARCASIPIRFSRLPVNSGGPSRPLNVGIASAQSEIIALLDQDDLMRPGRLETQVKAVLDNPDCSVALGRFSIMGYQEGDMTPIWPTSQFSDLGDQVDPAKPISIPTPETAFRALLIRNFSGSCSNFCFTRQSWKSIGGFDEGIRTCVDLDFMFKAVLSGPVVIVSDTLYDYRWRQGSLNHSNAAGTDLELTIVRWKAALARPDWAGAQIQALRQAIRHGGKTALRRGDLGGIAMVAKTVFGKGGLRLLQTS